MEIDQLPDLVLFQLFSLLSCEEKIRLKAVCRRLNCLLTDHLTEIPRRLFVHNEVISLSETWGSPDQPTKHKEFIHLKLFLRCLEVGYFKKVKCLYLYELDVPNKSSPYGNPLLLSCLAQLDELFVTNGMDFYDLPNLKSISIKRSCWKPVQIKSQKLEMLIFWNFPQKPVTLSNPEMIRHIECTHFGEKEFQLDAFLNLEYLNCQSITANFQLSKYPKLKKLGVCPSKDRLENEFDIVNRLIAEKQALRRSDLEITVSGFKELSSIAYRGDRGTFDLEFEDLRKLKENFSSFVAPLPGYTRSR